MPRRLWLVFITLLVVLPVWPTANVVRTQQTFRSRTTAVNVNVSVLNKMNPVSGLEASDFEILDNGVPQQLKALSAGSVPVDVSLIVDVSFGALARLDDYRAEIVRMAALLRPTDNLRILSFGSLVTEVQPMTRATARPMVERLQTSRRIALNNALIAALIREPQIDRRHLVIAFSPTVDGDSVITGSTVLEIAKQADAVLHVVIASWKPPSEGIPVPVGPRLIFRSAERMRDALQEASESTGGELRQLSGSIVRQFQQVFEQFRAGYVLTYEPAGVAVDGWHKIEVRLKQPGNYLVRARSGYFGR